MTRIVCLRVVMGLAVGVWREGHPETAMTAWDAELLEEDMINVLAYIRSLTGGPGKGL